MIPRHRLNLLFVLLVAAAITGYQMFSQPLSTPVADAVGYLANAVNLDVHGVFSYTRVGPSDDPPPPDMFFGPLYPGFLAAIAKLSPDFAEYAACVVGTLGEPEAVEALCPHRFGVAIIAQFGLAVLSSLLVYVGASFVCGTRRHAWIAMLLALVTGEYAYYATRYLTEVLVFPLFTLFSIQLVYGWRKPDASVWAAAGATLGLLVLVRPSFLYLGYFTLFCLVVAFARRRPEPALVGAGRIAAGVLGLVVVVSPWVARNWLVHDVAAITDGYASFILVQRVAYNAMTYHEWLVSWIFWFPDFGAELAAHLFEPESYLRLTFNHPDSFYLVGNSTLRAATLEAAGGPANHLDYLLREYVLGDLGKHVLVTLPLAVRGIWISSYEGAIMLLLFLSALVHCMKTRHYELVILAVPAWFMLGFHAFVSVNVTRYNLIMIPGLAIGSAIALLGLGDRLRAIGARFVGTGFRGDESARD